MDTKKKHDKIQQLFIIKNKTLSKLGTEGDIHNIIRGYLKKTMAHVFKNEMLQVSPLRMPTITTSIQHYTGGSSQ